MGRRPPLETLSGKRAAKKGPVAGAFACRFRIRELCRVRGGAERVHTAWPVISNGLPNDGQWLSAPKTPISCETGR